MVSMSSITEASSPHARARTIVRRHRRRRIGLPGATGAHPAAWPIVRTSSLPPRNQDGRHARPARWVRVGIESVRSIKTNTPGAITYGSWHVVSSDCSAPPPPPPPTARCAAAGSYASRGHAAGSYTTWPVYAGRATSLLRTATAGQLRSLDCD
jgi:hypothetical protein